MEESKPVKEYTKWNKPYTIIKDEPVHPPDDKKCECKMTSANIMEFRACLRYETKKFVLVKYKYDPMVSEKDFDAVG